MYKEYLRLLKENKNLIAIILVLTFVFAYNDPSESLQLSSWIKNFIFILFLTSISFLGTFLGFKLGARYFNSKIELYIPKIKRFGFKKSSNIENIKFGKRQLKAIPLGIIIAIFIALVSYGKIFFTLIYSFNTSTTRIGYRFRELPRFQEALISASGIGINLILAIIFTLLSIKQGYVINLWLVIWNLVPIGNLPGGKIFIGSINFWIFMVALSMFILLLLPVLNILLTIVLSVVFALAIGILFFKQFIYK